MREIIGAVLAVALWYLFLMSFNSFATWTFYEDLDISKWSDGGRALFLSSSIAVAILGAMAATNSRSDDGSH